MGYDGLRGGSAPGTREQAGTLGAACGGRTATASTEVRRGERFERVARSTLCFALTGVSLFLVLFAACGSWALAALAALSLPADWLALRLVRRGRVDLPLVIGGLVVVVDAVADTLLLGVDSGFLVYLPVLSIVLFMHPRAGLRTKIAWGSVLVAIPLGLVAIVELVRPLAPVSAGLTHAFALLNAAFVMALLSFLAYVVIEAADTAERELRVALGRLEEVARTDVLTGLHNRRAMTELLDAEVDRLGRAGGSSAVLLGDVDDFKRINDTYGHSVGDHVLRLVGDRLAAAVRRQDRVARWGGEEFLVLLPGCDLESGRRAAVRLLAAVSEPPLEVDGHEIVVTLTFGVAAHATGCTVDSMIRDADHALYAGKESGKNRVVRARG